MAVAEANIEKRDISKTPETVSEPKAKAKRSLGGNRSESVTTEEEKPHRTPKDYSAYPERQRQLLTLLAEGKKTADQLASQTGIPVGVVLAELTMLEIGGEVGALPGGYYETI